MLISLTRSRWVRRAAWLLGAAAFIAISTGLLLHFASKPLSKELMNGNDSNPKLQTVRTFNGSSDSVTAVIAHNVIPKTQSARMNAPADTLIPSDWASDPQPTEAVGGPQADAVAVPAGQRDKMMETVFKFLEAWETFGASTHTVSPTTGINEYANNLAPYSDASDLADLVNRVDNNQPTYICDDCAVGSKFLSTYKQLWLTSRVRAFNSGENAYVTVYGDVQYQSEVPDEPLAGTKWMRSYGLLLTDLNGTWLVTRCAASTVSELDT
jgi:hypothetical protein